MRPTRSDSCHRSTARSTRSRALVLGALAAAAWILLPALARAGSAPPKIAAAVPEGTVVRRDLGPSATRSWSPEIDWSAAEDGKRFAAAPLAPEIVPWPSSWMTFLTEGFESVWPGGAWTAFDNDGPTNGEYYWDDDDFLPYAGIWSAWPANGGADGVDPQYYNYPANLRSWMIFGPFSLAGVDRASWSFRLWNRSEPGYDQLFHGVSTDGSSFYGPYDSGDTDGWVTRYVDFASAPYFGNLLGDDSVWIAFQFTSDGTVSDWGPFVDEVSLLVDPGPGTGIDGHVVRAQWRYPTFADDYESHYVVVGPGVELPTSVILQSNSHEIDLEGSTIRYDFVETTSFFESNFNGWSFADSTGRIPPIADIEVSANPGNSFGNIGCNFDGDNVWCDFAGHSAAAGDWLEVRLFFQIFSDGFETGQLGNWTGALPSI